MKKFLAISLVIILGLGLVGCNKEEDKPNIPDNPPIVDNSGDDNNSGDNEPNEPIEDPTNDPTSAINTITEIMTKANVEVSFPMKEAIQEEMSESFIGLTSGDFKEYVVDSVAYESMISPSNRSFCLIKVNNLDKVEDLKKTIFENCNPRKWICMSAERVVVLDSGEYIMLVMADKDECDTIIEAFKSHFDNNVGPVLDKVVEE